MKKLIFVFALLSTGVFAQSADYICHVRNYRLDLHLRQDRSTHFWLTDTMNHYTVSHGYPGSIERAGDKVKYLFYPGNASPVMMMFNYQDTIDLPAKLPMYIETKAGGFLLWEKMVCSRRS